MRRQSTLLHTINSICSSILEVEGGKIGKVVGHLDHVCKMLEKTSIVCEQDLENKCPSWDLFDPLQMLKITLMLMNYLKDTAQKIQSYRKWRSRTGSGMRIKWQSPWLSIIVLWVTITKRFMIVLFELARGKGLCFCILNVSFCQDNCNRS
jgi:hypothetical protein